MADDNHDPLDDVAEQLQQTEDGIPETERTPDTSASSDDSRSVSDPAFPFEEAQQRPLYPRARRWDDYRRLRLQVRMAMSERSESFGDIENREIDDAVLAVACDHVGEIVSQLYTDRMRTADADGD